MRLFLDKDSCIIFLGNHLCFGSRQALKLFCRKSVSFILYFLYYSRAGKFLQHIMSELGNVHWVN